MIAALNCFQCETFWITGGFMLSENEDHLFHLFLVQYLQAISKFIDILKEKQLARYLHRGSLLDSKATFLFRQIASNKEIVEIFVESQNVLLFRITTETNFFATKGSTKILAVTNEPCY